MRKQYHARPVGEDVHIWDVHKLVRASKTLPVIQIAPESIAEIDAAWWFGDGNAATPRAIAAHFRLAMAVDPTHPILLCAEGRLMDGMHRVVRALAEGRVTLPARRFTTTPPPDFTNVALEDLPYPDEPV